MHGRVLSWQFIRDEDYKCGWMIENIETWQNNMNMISKTEGKYPQESYAAVVRALSLEWIFIQCITNNTGDTFAGVEKILC